MTTTLEQFPGVKATRPENLRATINLIRGTKESSAGFDLTSFQSNTCAALESVGIDGDDRDVVYTVEHAHQCGTTACVAGWAGLSPEFVADGGAVGTGGEPYYKDKGSPEDQSTAETMARFWGLPDLLCAYITGVWGFDLSCEFYKVEKLEDVDAEHAARVLERYL